MLAIWGNNEEGKAYVHIRTYKQGRIFGEVVVLGGEVRICCRECLRWHRITFVGERSKTASLEQITAPEEIDRGEDDPETNSNEG